MKKLTITKHLTIDELKQKRANCKDGNEANRWSAIIIMQEEGVSANEAANRLKISHETVRKAVNNYNELGADGLEDKRKKNGKKTSKVNEQLLNEIDNILSNPPDYIGIWTGQKLRQWIKDEHGVCIGLTTVYNCIHSLDYSLQVPRPKHYKSSDEDKDDFKKNSSRRI